MTTDTKDDCPVGADDALARLMEGNALFLRGEPLNTRTPMEVLADLSKGQRPFATILGCGAVQAALAAKFEGVQERSRIQLLLQSLLPGLDGIDPLPGSSGKMRFTGKNNPEKGRNYFPASAAG